MKKILPSKKLLFTSLIVLTFAIQQQCFAANWKTLSQENNNITMIDTSSILYNQNIVKAWFLSNVNIDECIKSKSEGSLNTFYICEILSRKQLLYFNCTNKTFYLARVINYSEPNGKGNIVYDDNLTEIDNAFNDVVPDTISETMLNFSCNYIKLKDKKVNKKYS